jgi:chaperone modulatory protein CbpM
MKKHDIVIIADYTSSQPLSLAELIEITHLSSDFIVEMIEYGVIHPQGGSSAEWLFDLAHLKRIKAAQRLQRDLEVNMAGIAVVLDLIDEMNELETKLALLERHLIK